MYIPKRTRLEMFLKRKVSTKTNSRKNSAGKDVSNNDITNWSETCAVFIKDIVLKRRISFKGKKSITEHEDNLLSVDPKLLCFDQLSEFQKSYVSFPEFNDSTISNESNTESECSYTNTQPSWGLTSSFSFASYTSSNI